MSGARSSKSHGLLARATRIAVAAGAVATAYMVFESQWVECRRADLVVP